MVGDWVNGDRRSHTYHHGICMVFVPRSQRIGLPLKNQGDCIEPSARILGV